jgi:hypothetical protein
MLDQFEKQPNLPVIVLPGKGTILNPVDAFVRSLKTASFYNSEIMG